MLKTLLRVVLRICGIPLGDVATAIDLAEITGELLFAKKSPRCRFDTTKGCTFEPPGQCKYSKGVWLPPDMADGCPFLKDSPRK